MIKKYVLGMILMFIGLGNNLYGMQQNQSWWNRFTSWVQSPNPWRKDYVEINMPQVPPHPEYPKKQEIQALREVAYVGTGYKPRNDTQQAHTWEQPGSFDDPEVVSAWKDISTPGGKWTSRKQFPYKKDNPFQRIGTDAEQQYSNKVPTREDLQELEEKSIKGKEKLARLELLEAKRRLADTQNSWFWWLNPFATKEKAELRRAEMQQAAIETQSEHLRPYAKNVRKWLDTKESIERQQTQRRATAQKYEEREKSIPNKFYGE